jgi:hypothetical protein
MVPWLAGRSAGTNSAKFSGKNATRGRVVIRENRQSEGMYGLIIHDPDGLRDGGGNRAIESNEHRQ